jgi:hypothetical protein
LVEGRLAAEADHRIGCRNKTTIAAAALLMGPLVATTHRRNFAAYSLRVAGLEIIDSIDDCSRPTEAGRSETLIGA